MRGDLLKRHMDRHAAKGSQLNHRDSMSSHTTPAVPPGSASPETSRNASDLGRVGPPNLTYQQAHEVSNGSYTPTYGTPPNAYPNGPEGFATHEANFGGPTASRAQPHSPTVPARIPTNGSTGSYGVLSPVSNQHGYHGQQGSTPPSGNFVSQQNVMPFTLPPAQYANGSNSAARESGQPYVPSTSAEYSEPVHSQASEMVMLDQMAMPGNVPVFGGGDGDLNKSPYVGMPEDFMAYLFNTPSGEGSSMGQAMQPSHSKLVNPPVKKACKLTHPSYGELQNSQNTATFLGADSGAGGFFPTAPQQVMAVNNILDTNVPEAALTEEKSQEIVDFIKEHFHENEDAPVERQADNILDGDRTNPEHMLSRRMMQAYIGSYWYHFSDQIPILHKPTFLPDQTPNLLLLAMMTIGAACLDRTHGLKVTIAGARLSNFLAWNLRWKIFMDVNLRPPAKLWGFQTLILLELYEKMYSTRELHERAHIHHATTITLMRRGRSLIGKSAAESPPNPRDGGNGSRQSSISSAAATPDKWWNHWVTHEATRRAAFAAFVVDSIHATMFGHSAVMVAHEMRLPLPCDESLWRASSSAEVGRVESNLMSNGIKPISFLEGLKRTLSNHEVQTTSFGRTVLMAGLLSVSWHMHQRDLQVNVLGGGIVQALGGRDRWRATLTRAYDSWKADFDKALQRVELSNDPYRDEAATVEFNVIFESRTVLHHLAHMAMHADIVDCQMFARAKRLLGRTIGPQEFTSAQRRIKDNWAHSARARDATFYALKFLCSVLSPDKVGPPHAGGYHLDEPYEARDDVLLNRPWVLYFAALVVWCYSFALEGPCPHVAQPTTRQEKLQHMRGYLARYGTIESPANLQHKTGINENTALLMYLRDTFENTRWELLHEGSYLLNNCILLNAGGTVS